jgi:hypothetical protein
MLYPYGGKSPRCPVPGINLSSPPASVDFSGASVASHADGILSEPRAQASGFYAPRRQLEFAFLETTLFLRHYISEQVSHAFCVEDEHG